MLNYQDLATLYSIQSKKERVYKDIMIRLEGKSNKKITQINRALLKFGMLPLVEDGVHKNPRV